MAELTIRLRRDPNTGKQDIIVTLKSDDDALPHEHEQMHRDAVEKLLGKGSVGKVIVEREAGKEPTSPIGEETPPERQAQGQAKFTVSRDAEGFRSGARAPQIRPIEGIQ